MPTYKIAVDEPTDEKLIDMALHERRPIPMQAEVLLRKAIHKAHRAYRTAQAAEQAPTDGGGVEEARQR